MTLVFGLSAAAFSGNDNGLVVASKKVTESVIPGALLRLDDTAIILQGALAAVLLALAVQAFFGTYRGRTGAAWIALGQIRSTRPAWGLTEQGLVGQGGVEKTEFPRYSPVVWLTCLTMEQKMQRLFSGLLFLICAGTAVATEEPSYTVIEKSGDFELRAYSPMIVAETRVSGPMDDASGAGFRLIADYIFGNNTSRAGGNEKISMTAPVTMKPQSEKISMTAPVTMEQTGEQWRVHFVMPSEYTLDTLPTPNNPAVSLREVPASNYAVIRFSGWVGEKKIAVKTAELLAWLANKGITPIGEPELARYNPPWTLPFLRRNEVMVAY